MNNDCWVVLCTCPDAVSAEAIATTLVERGLAACANIVPGVRSIYMWKGKREISQEHLLVIKTTEDRYESLELAILDSHPYELPEIIAVPLVTGLVGYLDWVRAAVRR